MFTLLVVLAIITATLLILVVFVQSSKKEGLGSPLGSTGASQLIGIQKTGDLLEQLTWGLNEEDAWGLNYYITLRIPLQKATIATPIPKQ